MAKGRVQTDWSGLCRLIETSLTESKPAVTEDPGFWYLDNAGQPNGPVSSTELQTLFKGSRITAGTLVARRGDPGWVRLETVPGFATIVSVDGSVEAPAGTVVKCRRSHDFAIPMGVTLSFFSFYLVPSYSRDMRLITGKPRIQFKPLLVLGIVTIGLALSVMLTVWAFDLERHGKEKKTPRGRKSLGEHV